jgi:hypothetical protein
MAGYSLVLVPAQPMRLTRILALSPAQVPGTRDPATSPLTVLMVVDRGSIPQLSGRERPAGTPPRPGARSVGGLGKGSCGDPILTMRAAAHL